jgi:hypothetical protein
MTTCKHCSGEIRPDCSTVYMDGGPPVRWLHIGMGRLCDPQRADSTQAEVEGSYLEDGI